MTGTTAGFLLFLVITVLLLGGVILSGRAARRRLHLGLVITTLASLGITIFFAEKLGAYYDLKAAGWITPLHLTLAKICVFAYIAPIVTGVITFRGNAKMRKTHAKLAYVVLALTVLTFLTGTMMILAAEPIG